MRSAFFPPFACAIALVVVACSGGDEATPLGAPTPASTASTTPNDDTPRSDGDAAFSAPSAPTASSDSGVQGLGTDCSKAEDCPSGFCSDGVCCNEACTGRCRSCGLEGSKGICSNIPYYVEDLSYVNDEGDPRTCDFAIAGAVCDGNGNCRSHSGVTCTKNEQCISGQCANLKCLGAPGEGCIAHAGCVSGTCSVGACQ
jgi:hypothetical protein